MLQKIKIITGKDISSIEEEFSNFFKRLDIDGIQYDILDVKYSTCAAGSGDAIRVFYSCLINYSIVD